MGVRINLNDFGESISVTKSNVFFSEHGNGTFFGGPIADFWIGLTNMINPPDWAWTDGTTLDYTNWRESPKKKPRNLNSCGSVARSDGRWNSDDCFKAKPFVCKVPNSDGAPMTTKPAPPITTRPQPATTRAPAPVVTTGGPASCPTGWTYFGPTQACYLLTPPLDWTTAEDYCVNRSAHLASIHNFVEFNFFDGKSNLKLLPVKILVSFKNLIQTGSGRVSAHSMPP